MAAARVQDSTEQRDDRDVATILAALKNLDCVSRLWLSSTYKYVIYICMEDKEYYRRVYLSLID